MLGNRSFTKKFAVGIVCLLGRRVQRYPVRTCSTIHWQDLGAIPVQRVAALVGGASAAAELRTRGVIRSREGATRPAVPPLHNRGNLSRGGIGSRWCGDRRRGSYHTCATLSNGSVRCWATTATERSATELYRIGFRPLR